MKYNGHNSNTLVSIIVANYNNAQYLQECFDSILKQTYKDIEIVVVDDCSTDHSREVIQSYEAKYPEFFSSVFLLKNMGVARARHEGILKAKGQYITTLDADDYYADENKLEKEIKIIFDFKKKYNEDVIAFSNILLRFPDGSVQLVGHDKNILQGNILENIMARSCMIPRDFTFLKDIYFEVGCYDPTFPIYEDWDLKIRIAYRYKFFYAGVVGIVYLRHGSGLSNATEDFHINVVNKIFQKNQCLLDKSRVKYIQMDLLKYTNKLKSRFFLKNITTIRRYYHEKKVFGFIKLWVKFARIDSSLLCPRSLYRLIKHDSAEF